MQNDLTPVVTLAARSWPIPVLAPRQNRIIVPALLEIIPRILHARSLAVEEGDAATWSRLGQYLDTATYDRLAEAVFHALTRAHPELSRSEFDDMPIDTAELLGAIDVVARQAGLLK